MLLSAPPPHYPPPFFSQATTALEGIEGRHVPSFGFLYINYNDHGYAKVGAASLLLLCVWKCLLVCVVCECLLVCVDVCGCVWMCVDVCSVGVGRGRCHHPCAPLLLICLCSLPPAFVLGVALLVRTGRRFMCMGVLPLPDHSIQRPPTLW